MTRFLLAAVFSVVALAQSPRALTPADRAAQIQQIIDKSVGALPAGFKGMIVGYLDANGPAVYKTYGIATVDGTVALNEKTLFGVGSATKLFAATLLAVANTKGLPLTTSALSLMPAGYVITPAENRYSIRLLDLADHHAGLPKNEGHLYNATSDLFNDYAHDPITCNPATPELIHDCGCCDSLYMSLLGLQPTCGSGQSNASYTCPTHKPTVGGAGWVYSNLGFEMLGPLVATWLGYPDWNTANLKEITGPLNMPDTVPLESFTANQISRAANHCSPATRATNTNCALLDWLPVGNAAGGLFSTASDMLAFLSYNAFGNTAPAAASLQAALPVIHQNYETYPQGRQELGWQNFVISTGEVEHWKDGSNGPFNSFSAYVTGSMTRMVVILDNSGGNAANIMPITRAILEATGPSISSVTTANGTADISQNTWIVIKGSELVPVTTPAAGQLWDSSPSFAQGQMPTSVGNVSVQVNGKPAFVWFYCSAFTSGCAQDQINVLTPLDNTTGPVQVIVTNNGVSSLPFTVNMKALAPAFLQFSTAGYVVAQHPDYSLIGPANLFPGLSSPAKPTETILVYGVGFGLPAGGATNGSASQSGNLPATPVCTIANLPASVGFAGLQSPGLDVFAITIPQNAPNGDDPISCTFSGASTPAGNLVPVQR